MLIRNVIAVSSDIAGSSAAKLDGVTMTEATMSDDVVRILSIDGGGIRGIIPAMVLQTLLKDRNAQDVFHLVAGTSTGGIIACGLAKPNPMTLTEIIGLYVEHGAEIFNPASGSGGILGPKYSPAALMKYLGEEFEKTHLSDINASGDKTELLIPSYAIGLPRESSRQHVFADVFPKLGSTGTSAGGRRNSRRE